MQTQAPNLKNVPQPFLGSLFEPGVEPIIATGYNYSPQEAAIHGIEVHNAIDFDLPRGVKILAPADGYYVATYGEFKTRLKTGEPRRLSMGQALKGNPLNKDLRPPAHHGEFEVYFGSYVIQGWHTHGRYTQYAHVDWASPEIPYYPPKAIKDDQGTLTGDLQHADILRAPVAEYRKPNVAAFIRAGEVIGEVGMSGCGWGRRCYDFAKFDLNGRPDFRGVNYTYYTEPHLHFMVFGKRVPYRRVPSEFYDPFGVYGLAGGDYPPSRAQWQRKAPAAKHAPLWA